MIFDLFDYILGEFKMLFYNIFYLGKFKYNIIGKYSSKFQLRIFDGGSIEIGKNVVIRAGVKIRINKNGKIKIGDNVGLNNYCLLNAMDNIIIGDNVIFGQGIKVYDHDHDYKNSEVIRNAGFQIAPVVIENNVWIGSNCVILKGSHIGANSVIAAGTIVRRDVPANSVAYDKRELIIKV